MAIKKAVKVLEYHNNWKRGLIVDYKYSPIALKKQII